MRYIGFMKISHPSLYLDMQNLQCCIKHFLCVMIHIQYKTVEKWNRSSYAHAVMISWKGFTQFSHVDGSNNAAQCNMYTWRQIRLVNTFVTFTAEHRRNGSGRKVKRKRRRRIRGKTKERTKRRWNASKSITE